MTDYIQPEELRAYIGSDTTNFEDLIQLCCTAASRSIEGICGRSFVDAGSVSARRFSPCDPYYVDVDDFSTTSGLIVQTDTGYNFSYGTTLTLNTDFFVEPVNQLRGALPWPYTRLVATALSNLTYPFPPLTRAWRQPTIQVTARWGWAAVPAPIKDACLMAGAQLFKLKDAPDGFVGIDGWGPTKVKENALIRATVADYTKSIISVA